MPSTQRVVALVSSTDGSGWRDGGILDFGREHAYLDELANCEIVLPQGLVTFIEKQAIQRSEQQHAGAPIGAGDADARHRQAGPEQEVGDANG